MPGDVMQLSHSSGLFRVDEVNEEISRRLAKQQIHVTGPLAGLPARIMPQGAAQRYEQYICQEYQFWSEGLERCGLRADRRALRASAAPLFSSVTSDTSPWLSTQTCSVAKGAGLPSASRPSS